MIVDESQEPRNFGRLADAWVPHEERSARQRPIRLLQLLRKPGHGIAAAYVIDLRTIVARELFFVDQRLEPQSEMQLLKTSRRAIGRGKHTSIV